MNDLTDRQQSILDYIQTYSVAQGYPPSIREICHHFGYRSLRTVQVHLGALERKGWLRRNPGRSRGLELVEGRETGIPVLGRIAAGSPLLAIENLEGRIPIRKEFFGSGQHFALQVHGESMTGAGIMDGDYCIVRAQPNAIRGQLVAAVIDTEATVKRFTGLSAGRMVLHAENPSYSDIECDPSTVMICGVVVGVWRDLS